MSDFPELHAPAALICQDHHGCKPDGVYFGLPEGQYHAEPRLSTSAMKWLKISPRDFWVRSWMNPDRPEEEDTDAKESGSAHHKRILEGRDAFYRAYAAALEPADYPDALRTVEDIKARLVQLEQKVTGRKDDLIARLLDADPSTDVWDVLVAEHAKANAGKTLLRFEHIKRIEFAAAMIERHPALAKCFTGGYPEVTVFWTDQDTGVPMKARLDYLKVKAIVDLKTFSNPLGKGIDAAIYAAMASRKYHIQAANYVDAANKAKALIRDGRVHGNADRAWLDRFAATPEPEFIFVFQDTGPAQIARGKIFPKRSMYQIGQVEVRHLVSVFAECRERFGDGPWVDDATIEEFDDALFPAYATAE